MSYYILEVASTHGGSMAYVDQLLNEFERFEGAGIKFQPLKYDLLAEVDYKGYNTYKTLYFDEGEWKQIISKACKSKEVWLDLFDEYSLDILLQNFKEITGFKIQASVLGNFMLFERLSSTDLSGKQCILNVSGYELENLKDIIDWIKNIIHCEIILQAGFQSHPTDFFDSGLSKIGVLKSEFPEYSLSFTDHLEQNSGDILLLPFVASMIGVDIIEKHIKCENLETKFDHYSSITHNEFSNLWDMSIRYAHLLKQYYINEKERQYLSTSLLVPVLKTGKKSGQILSKSDFYYKRTSKKGLDSFSIFNKENEFYVLSADLAAGSTIQQENLRPARIGAAVACRMKSKRLPKKALIRIGKLTSIELCLKNTLDFERVDQVILATSTHPDDEVLKNHTYSNKVAFFRGSEDDVIDRFIKLADTYRLDILIRVTGDSPYRSNEVLQTLLISHFNAGADYSAVKNAPLGTNTEVINVEALKRVYDVFNGTPYSEYMSYYFKNNPELFKLNFITVPSDYTNDFRLTLDYDEDLRLFQKIEDEFNHADNKFNALALYRFLDKNPQIAAINRHCEVSYTPDSELMNQIIEKTTLKKRLKVN